MKAPPKTKNTRPMSTVAFRQSDGVAVETVLRLTEQRTHFCVWRGGRPHYEDRVEDRGRIVAPYSASNNLIRHGVIRFPSESTDYESEAALVAEIRAFIHEFVDLSPLFEAIASYYVLLTWVYDNFNELPYLRVIGDPGSGKTRFLLTVGSICYLPIFASGASSVSPIFRMLDAFSGTLVFDEADFSASDERADMIKILNNGHARGFPVLRSDASRSGEYNPKAYRVFGPKLVATRRDFQDRALESRCITEELGSRRLRADIPISLPASHGDRALQLRNKLLTFRFRNLGRSRSQERLVDGAIEPRLNQIFVPLLSLVEDEKVREDLIGLARQYHQRRIDERGQDPEAQALEIIRDMRAQDAPLAVSDIATWFADRYGDDYDRKVTAKWIGWIVRKRLRLQTQKRGGVYFVADGMKAKLELLFERYGIDTVGPEQAALPMPPKDLPRP